jgi:hypothetical protein
MFLSNKPSLFAIGRKKQVYWEKKTSEKTGLLERNSVYLIK